MGFGYYSSGFCLCCYGSISTSYIFVFDKMDVRIFKLEDKNLAPFELMLLADPSRDMIEEYLVKGTCFVVENENEDIIGCYVLKSNSPVEVEIMNIAVAERFQGKGIGKKMLEHAMNYAKKSGYTQLVIATANSSMYQLYLYQKIGFEMMRIERDYFINHYSNKIQENGIPTKHKVVLGMKL